MLVSADEKVLCLFGGGGRRAGRGGAGGRGRGRSRGRRGKCSVSDFPLLLPSNLYGESNNMGEMDAAAIWRLFCCRFLHPSHPRLDKANLGAARNLGTGSPFWTPKPSPSFLSLPLAFQC